MGYGEGSQVSVPAPPWKCHITVPVITAPWWENVQLTPMSRLPAGPAGPAGPVAPVAPSVPVAP